MYFFNIFLPNTIYIISDGTRTEFKRFLFFFQMDRFQIILVRLYCSQIQVYVVIASFYSIDKEAFLRFLVYSIRSRNKYFLIDTKE